jgi:hypothetical protein
MNTPLLPTLPTHCQRCRWHYRHRHAATLPPPFRVAVAAVPLRCQRNFYEFCQRPLAVSHPVTLKVVTAVLLLAIQRRYSAGQQN